MSFKVPTQTIPEFCAGFQDSGPSLSAVFLTIYDGMSWKDQGAEQDVMALTASCLGALHWESWGTVYFLFFQQKWIDVIGSSCLKSQHRMDSIKAPSNVTFPAPRINCWPTSWTRAAALIIYDPCWVEYPQAVLKSSFSSCTLWSVALIATEGLDF